MQIHTLKTHPEPFSLVWCGKKQYEYRKDDRDFLVGDILILHEYDPKLVYPDSENGPGGVIGHTDRWIVASIESATFGPDFGVKRGYAVMSIEVRARWTKDTKQRDI